MSYPRITFKANGGEKIEYQLYEYPSEIDTDAIGCQQCASMEHIEDGTIIQHGLWEDRLWIFRTCQSCGKHAVSQQDLPFHWEVTK